MTPIQQVDEIWTRKQRREIGADEAAARIRELIDVTETGAYELLSHPVMPSARYSQH